MAFILSIFKSSDNGHVKTKIEQENAEEGAIGGINNIAAIKLDAGEYAKAEESALSLDLKMERIKASRSSINHCCHLFLFPCSGSDMPKQKNQHYHLI
jgi:hypothetical protein